MRDAGFHERVNTLLDNIHRLNHKDKSDASPKVKEKEQGVPEIEISDRERVNGLRNGMVYEALKNKKFQDRMSHNRPERQLPTKERLRQMCRTNVISKTRNRS